MTRPWKALIVCAIVLFGASVSAVALFTSLDASTQASIWVAVGTLALAVTTVISIIETRQVLQGEEKRFQQSVAPFVVVSPFKDDDGRFLGLKARNVGKGLARNIRIDVQAFHYPDEIDEDDDIQNVVVSLDKDESVRSWKDEALVEVVPENGAEIAYFRSPYYTQPLLSETLIRRIDIVYLDMFGNEYRTTSEKYYQHEYVWRPPAAYKIGR